MSGSASGGWVGGWYGSVLLCCVMCSTTETALAGEMRDFGGSQSMTGTGRAWKGRVHVHPHPHSYPLISPQLTPTRTNASVFVLL